MSNLSDIRNYIFNYNGYDVSIQVINETHIVIDNEPFNISIVDAYIKEKDKSKIYLGSFFVHLPKILEQADEEKLISTLINDINKIICDRYRYIGSLENTNISDENIINALKRTYPKPLEDELKNMYLEFLSIDKNKDQKKYRNYSSFLEFYFYGQEHIPDSIKTEYLRINKKKSLLDYENIDKEIRLQFSGNTYESHKKEKDELRKKINLLNEENNQNKKELFFLEDFIKACEFLYNVADNNDRIECEIKRLENKIRKIKIALLKKSQLKKELNKKKSDSKTLNKTVTEGTKSLKEDIERIFPELKEKLKTISLGNLYNLLDDMIKTRTKKLSLNEKNKSKLESEIFEFEEDDLDFSYFFERINQINNILENRKGQK